MLSFSRAPGCVNCREAERSIRALRGSNMGLVTIGLIGCGAAVVTGLLFGAALKLFGRPSSSVASPSAREVQLHR